MSLDILRLRMFAGIKFQIETYAILTYSIKNKRKIERNLKCILLP